MDPAEALARIERPIPRMDRRDFAAPSGARRSGWDQGPDDQLADDDVPHPPPEDPPDDGGDDCGNFIPDDGECDHGYTEDDYGQGGQSFGGGQSAAGQLLAQVAQLQSRLDRVAPPLRHGRLD